MLNEDIELAQVVREANQLVESANLNEENVAYDLGGNKIWGKLTIHLQVGYVELPVCRQLLLGSCLEVDKILECLENHSIHLVEPIKCLLTGFFSWSGDEPIFCHGSAKKSLDIVVPIVFIKGSPEYIPKLLPDEIPPHPTIDSRIPVLEEYYISEI